jgi:predicted transcriptional regulator
MSAEIPSIESVRVRLGGLKSVEVDELAVSSGVPSSTLWKIRTGVTPNPGLETVRKFFHLLPTPASSDTNAAQAAQQGVANA